MLTRRQLLDASLVSLLFSGCTRWNVASDDGGAAACNGDPFAGGTLLGLQPFVEDASPLEVASGDGLDGRLFTDLRKLAPDSLVTPNELFYVRTRKPDLLDTNKPWTIAVSGLVTAEKTLSLDALAKLTKRNLGPYVMECSGNGSFASFGMLSAARWSGVLIEDLLPMLEPTSTATRLLIAGFDTYSKPPPPTSISIPGASWIFTFDQLKAAGAFLATEMNGARIPDDHGFPVRLVVPNWYGCTCLKWVDAITLVDENELATPHMREFAARTHQPGVPQLARDYLPATMDQAAMPVRIEKWRARDGKLLYRVVGIMWGGYAKASRLTIRLGQEASFVPVAVCPAQTSNATFTLFTHPWTPLRTGDHAIRMAIDDPKIPTRRLDRGFYERIVAIDAI